MSLPSTGMTDPEAEKAALNKRLEGMGWALFLILIGCLWLIPSERVPQGVWAIGIGLIMLALNAARLTFRIKPSGFTVVLGLLALASGIGELAGVDLPLLEILLILLGLNLLRKAFFERRELAPPSSE